MSENALEQDPELAPTSDEAIEEMEEESKPGFTIYEAMLGVSLVCVALAVFILFFELRKWGNYPFENPWNTAEVLESGN